MQPMRRGELVLALALSLVAVAGVIAFLAWFRHGMIATVAGKEYPPQEEGAWLKQGLESHFRWAGLPENSADPRRPNDDLRGKSGIGTVGLDHGGITATADVEGLAIHHEDLRRGDRPQDRHRFQIVLELGGL